MHIKTSPICWVARPRWWYTVYFCNIWLQYLSICSSINYCIKNFVKIAPQLPFWNTLSTMASLVMHANNEVSLKQIVSLFSLKVLSVVIKPMNWTMLLYLNSRKPNRGRLQLLHHTLSFYSVDSKMKSAVMLKNVNIKCLLVIFEAVTPQYLDENDCMIINIAANT